MFTSHTDSTTHRRRGRWALVAAATLLLGGLSVTGSGTPVAAAAAAATKAACPHLLAEAMPAAAAAHRMTTGQKRAAAAVNGTTVGELLDGRHAAAEDDTLWLDECGRRFYVEPDTGAQTADAYAAAQAAGTVAPSYAAGSGPVAPLADTLRLSSRPGSKHTIFLDFDGDVVTGTAWNTASWGGRTSISVPPYQLDGSADAAFTANELTQIQRAWSIVAEDYAPFDVNVTTADPGVAAIDRSGYADDTYGSHVLITAGGPIYDGPSGCRCGGIAYVGVFDSYGTGDYAHSYYQPAWVFTDGTSPADAKYFGEAASHEAGHNLGLSHDGVTTTAGDNYYLGDSPWAPIMGAGYYFPVTQWSRGEYANANNTEDDISVLAGVGGTVPDDHADTPSGATALTLSAASRPIAQTGVISTAADVDAFRFTANGPVTVDVIPTAVQPDLDVRATILDASGATVAVVDPAVVDNGRLNAAGGLDAHDDLAATPGATYTVLVDGGGSGAPGSAGGYSDYGSLGRYQVTVVGADPDQVTLANADGTTTAQTVTGTTVAPIDVTPFRASGGTGTFTWSATGLPAGLTLDASTGRLTGQAPATGTWTPTITATDSAGHVGSRALTVVIQEPDPLVLDTTAFSATVGEPFAGTLAAHGWAGGYTYAAAGAPAWLTVGADGTLSGTPTAAGRVTFDVEVSSGGHVATASVSVTAFDPAPVGLVAGAFDGSVGVAFDRTITATGGSGSRVYRLSSAVPGFPLTLDAGTGRLTGTPTAVGRWAFTVTATDAYDDRRRAAATYTLVVTGPLVIVRPSLTAVAGRAFATQLRAGGGDGTYTWAPTTALPRGLSLTSGGRLGGTPRAAGSYRFGVRVSSGAGALVQRRTATLVLTVMRAAPRFVRVAIPAGRVGSGYRGTLTVTGGTARIAWGHGRMPQGLELRARRQGHLLRLTGTPRAAGRYRITLTGRDGAGRILRRTSTVTIRR